MQFSIRGALIFSRISGDVKFHIINFLVFFSEKKTLRNMHPSPFLQLWNIELFGYILDLDLTKIALEICVQFFKKFIYPK